jgi:hypothetical protein
MTSRLGEGRLPEMVPLGGAGSGSLRLWLITSPVGVVPSLFPSLADGEAGGGSEKCRGGAIQLSIGLHRLP